MGVRQIDRFLEQWQMDARSLAGNPDSPQAVVFLMSIIDEIVSIATYYVHYHVISDWNTSVLRYTKPGKWLSGQTSRDLHRRLFWRRHPGSGNDGTPSGSWPKAGQLRVRRKLWDGILTPLDDGPPPLARVGLPP